MCIRRCPHLFWNRHLFQGGRSARTRTDFGSDALCDAQLRKAVRHKHSAWIAPTDDEFVAGWISLIQNPLWRNQLATEGHCLVGKQFSFAAFQTIVDETVQEAGVLESESIARPDWLEPHSAG